MGTGVDGSVQEISTLYYYLGLQNPMIMYRMMKVPLMIMVLSHIASFFIIRLANEKGN